MEEALRKNLIKILLFIHLMPYYLTLACNLRYFNKEWVHEWRLIVTHDNNNQYQLLRDHNVETNQKIYMVCNREPEMITVSCKNDNRFDQFIPLAGKCTARESVMPVRRTEKVSYCPYTLYRVGFLVKGQFLETYQVCFDDKHMRPVFTINKAYPVGGGRPDFLQFNPDDIFYGALFNAFSRRASFARFKYLLGNDQTYMSESNVDHIIDRGHLSPSADFTLTTLKRSTFNMINVIPQFKTIDNGNWRLIEHWTRDTTRTPANVCTGVLDCNLDSKSPADLSCVVKLKNADRKWVPIFLANNHKIPIPLWSYKIVKNPESSLVFLTLNNIYHEGEVELPKDVCQEIECPLNLSKTVKEGRTFCCSYEEFLSNNVPHLKNVC